MSTPLQKLLRLLDADQAVELRRAAALVLPEIAAKDDELSLALLEAMKDEDGAVRIAAIRAIGRLHVDKALPELLTRVQRGGEEAPPAAQAAANLGARGAKALRELMSAVPPGLRRIIAGALAGADQKADSGRLDVLLDSDPAVVHAAARSIAEKVPSLSAPQRRGLADQVLAMLQAPKAGLSNATASALVRLLAALDDPRGEAELWRRIGPEQPADVRGAALQALGKRPLASTKDHLKKLLTCALDRDFGIVAPALLLLKTVPVHKRSVGDWLGLFEAPDVAVRHFALEHVAAAVAAAAPAETLPGVLAQLDHPDAALRHKALALLAQAEAGRKALARTLVEEKNLERAWMLARALSERVASFSAGWRKEVFERVSRFLEAGDQHAEPLLFLLRHAEAKELRERLEEKAAALRKKKAYDKALHYLRVLGKDPACAFPTRLELAACGLKVSGRDLAPDAAARDPSLHQFEALYRNFGDELTAKLAGMKWLDADDLYYLGFHLADREGPSRKLAEAVLKLAVERGGKTKTAQAARNKLKSAGLK